MILEKKYLQWSENSGDSKSCFIYGIWDGRINDAERKATRVVVFPSHIDRKRVTKISVRFWDFMWPSLKKITVPDKSIANIICTDIDAVIEYK